MHSCTSMHKDKRDNVTIRNWINWRFDWQCFKCKGRLGTVLHWHLHLLMLLIVCCLICQSFCCRICDIEWISRSGLVYGRDVINCRCPCGHLSHDAVCQLCSLAAHTDLVLSRDFHCGPQLTNEVVSTGCCSQTNEATHQTSLYSVITLTRSWQSILFLLISHWHGSPSGLVSRAGNNWFESIHQSEFNQIPVKFNLSGHLQRLCQPCVPVGNKTGANCAVL